MWLEKGDLRGDNGLVFIGTLQAFDEIEQQAENGQLAYYYCPSFFEVWVKPEFIDFDKIEN